jgi:hypothetical protein
MDITVGSFFPFEVSHNNEMQMECISNRCIEQAEKNMYVCTCNLEYRHNHCQISLTEYKSVLKNLGSKCIAYRILNSSVFDYLQ